VEVPNPEYVAEGYAQLGVEVYGGVLLNSWLDRDLGLAGRVLIKGERGIENRLVRLDRQVLRVPQLAQLAVEPRRELGDRPRRRPVEHRGLEPGAIGLHVGRRSRR